MPHRAAAGSRLAQLIDAGLLTTEQLAQSRAAPGVGADDEDALVAELIRRKLVTSWQLDQLAKGRTSLFLEHGRYLLLEQIGRGGMGAVYKARHVRMGRVVALKIIDPKRVTDQSLVDRFRREVAVCSRLQHEHIVQTHDVGENKGLSFIVMEHVEGSDLASLVRRDGAMAPPEVAAIGLQAASALAYAHAQGIVHRDIKPQNILLSTSGVTKILDMGLARIVADATEATMTELTQDGAVMGTVDYMSPEQARNAHAVDSRSDIYSLGATLYFLLCGEPPYAGGTTIDKLHRLANEPPSPIQMRRLDCPQALGDIVHKMLAKRADDRYPTAEDVVRALRPLASERIAGRAVATSAVQAAAETHRETRYPAGQQETLPTFVADGDAFTTLRRPRRASRLSLALYGGGAIAVLGIALAIAILGRKVPRTPATPAVKPASEASASAPAGSPPRQVRRELAAHYGGIWSQAWSPDGLLLATGGRDGDVRINDPKTGRAQVVYRGHRGCIANVVWSPDGRRIASRDWSDQIHVWNAKTGKRVAEPIPSPASLSGHGDPQNLPPLIFSPDGRELAFTQGPQLVRWDLAAAKAVFADSFNASRIAWCSTQDLLAASGSQGEAAVWDSTTGERVVSLPPDQRLKLIGFQPEGTLVLAANDGVQFRNARTGEMERELRLDQVIEGLKPAQVHAMYLSASCRHCVVVVDGRFVRIDLATNESDVSPVPTFIPGDFNNHGLTLAFTTDQRLVSALGGPCWRFADGSQFGGVGALSVGSAAGLYALGSRFLRWSDPNVALDLVTGTMLADFPASAWADADGAVRGLVENRIVGFQVRGDAVERGETVGPMERTVENQFRRVNDFIRWTADGRLVYADLFRLNAIGQQEPGSFFDPPLAPGAVPMWDVETGRLLRVVAPGPEWSRLVSLPRGNGIVASSERGDVLAYGYSSGASTNHPLKVFRGEMESPALEFVPHPGGLGASQLAISSEGELVAIESADSIVHVFSAVDGSPQASIRDGSYSAMLTFSETARFLFITREIWDLQTQSRAWECPEPDRAWGPANYVNYRAGARLDGRHIAVGQDAQIQIWDWQAGHKRATLYFLPDGGWAFINHETGHWNGSVFAFQHLQFLNEGADGKPQWLSEHQYEKTTGWKNDPKQAGLNLTTPAVKK